MESLEKSETHLDISDDILEDMESLMYYDLLDEEKNSHGWEKQTVAFVLRHEKKVMNMLGRTAKSYGRDNVSEDDLKDMYQDFLYHLYKASDYDIFKSKHNISVEQFVNTCMRYFMKHYLSDEYKTTKNNIPMEISTEDDKEFNILNQ